jgi:hypothetical protein
VPLTIIGIRSKSIAAAPLAFFMRTSFEASFSGKKSMDDFSKVLKIEWERIKRKSCG